MSRLADYFVLVGYDHEKDRGGQSIGKIIQRFPEKDWDDCPCTVGIELFCQPAGWKLSPQRCPPEFFIAVLTDMDADRHYCACLSFSESVSVTMPRPDDDGDTDETENAIAHQSLMFSPKCLVLVSRLDYFETFRNCLGIIYTAYVDRLDAQLEVLVGNIIGCVYVPPPGGPQVRFSIGAGDRQALQPKLNSSIPSSRNCVALLFQQLGIHNTLVLFCAALTDHKIVFHSRSYSRLTDACQAIVVLHYPLKFSYVYIPILPAHLVEVLNSPTPYMAGVHSSLTEDTADLLDVIIVDLDGGSIKIPECVNIPMIPEPILSRTKNSLHMILNIELLNADMAFPQPPQKKQTNIEMKDKEIRAVFIRLFAELLTGYRTCLTVIRIHPEPFITFHKANFLSNRGYIEDDFLVRVLDCMAFGGFVAERGPPYRVCDIFDEIYANIQDLLGEERSDPNKMMENIKDLAKQLYTNENPNPQPYVQKVPKPTEGAYSRIHQPQFPYLDWLHVQEVIEEGIAKNNLKSKFTNMRPQQLRIVPIGPPATTLTERQRMVDNNARRLEVLRNCVNFIFENKISDGRIIFPAVLRALKSRVARTALTQELSYHIRSNRAMLEHQQFDLVVKLLNCALQNDSSMDENGIAAAILPLATTFCRKLCTGVIQFAYTCVQEHAVWGNLQFWEAAFYQDVQKQIKQLYAPHYEEHNISKDGAYSPTSNELSVNWNRQSSTTPDTKRRSGIRPREIGALEIAAEQLRVWPNLNSNQKEEMINNEESTVFSQAIHYANRMVYMRVPLDTKTSLKTYSDWESNSNSNITASLAESDSNDAESGFDETEVSDVGTGVIKFVMRFVDKVCNDSKVTQDHIKALHTMIPGVVAMHVETLEAVHRESKRLPPIQKPKILKPTLLQGEEIIMDGLRVYLLPDGREEGTGGNMGGPSLLPAEGAAFLTNYRIIFKGIPCDPLACEQVVVRYFPVSTMTKEKQIKLGYTPHIDQLPKEGIQIRSNIFQLMKLAFDEEVIPEDIDTFRKLSNKSRNPATVFQTFAFTGHVMIQPTPMHKHKEKNASLKNFAKKTLMKTARKAGIKPKQSSRKHKYVLPTETMQRRSMSPRSSGGSDSDSERPNSEMFDDLSIVDELEYASSLTTDPKTIEKLLQRPGYHDYERLGLNSLSTSHHSSEPKSEQFRVSTVNANFSVCRSYPALLVVPLSVTDDSITKLARTHRQYRFPVITWRHSRTKALLIRASGFHTRGLMGMLKHDTTSGSAGSETTSSIEQERYFSSLVAATPKGDKMYRPSCSDSLTSLDSLMMAGINVPETPDMTRKALKTGSLQRVTKPKSAAYDFEYDYNTFGRIGSIKEKTRTSADSSRLSQTSGMSDSRGDMINTSLQGFKRVSLYVLGEKAQMKGIKMESFPKCDFIPVDFYEVRHVKASFKKLMRACVPSSTPTADTTFYKTVEESEWLLQVQNVMQLAGATVDLIDVQGSSVMICLEDGWDITTQVVSTAQILLDPYYRTVEGFKCLIEKEWLSFGHRFTHRSNQTAANQASGFAPLFLQFLDVVHQIHNQFPLSFEFNLFFLKFLAYHYVSNRFRTFMMDNELERFESGWILEEKKASKFDETDEDGMFSHKQQSNPGMSVWDYIDKHHRRSPIFCNFLYSVHDQEMVLRPYSHLANLKIWDYYIDEDLAHGPPYELETVQKELALNEDVTVEGTPSSRRVINICFDNVQIQEPESFKVLLQEVHRIQTDLGHLQQKWRIIWDKLEGTSHDSMRRNTSFSTQVVKSHGRSIHKRSTLEILVKGKMLGEAAKRFSQPHRFEKFTYTTPAYCDYCSQVLWGFLKTGMHCADCGYNCHEKCMSHVPKNCTKLKIVSETSNSSSNVSRGGGSETSSVAGAVGLTGAHPSYENFTSSTSNSEHRTLEGYLYKKGALLKGWKQRWFVLDSTKHQMRYYDSMEDPNCKGYIDLFDVQAVHPIKNVQGPLKSKSEENAAFELKTSKRLYHFIASDAKTAQEWIDKIHSFI